jgi:hypothetical protein
MCILTTVLCVAMLLACVRNQTAALANLNAAISLLLVAVLLVLAALHSTLQEASHVRSCAHCLYAIDTTQAHNTNAKTTRLASTLSCTQSGV